MFCVWRLANRFVRSRTFTYKFVSAGMCARLSRSFVTSASGHEFGAGIQFIALIKIAVNKFTNFN